MNGLSSTWGGGVTLTTAMKACCWIGWLWMTSWLMNLWMVCWRKKLELQGWRSRNGDLNHLGIRYGLLDLRRSECGNMQESDFNSHIRRHCTIVEPKLFNEWWSNVLLRHTWASNAVWRGWPAGLALKVQVSDKIESYVRVIMNLNTWEWRAFHFIYLERLKLYVKDVGRYADNHLIDLDCGWSTKGWSSLLWVKRGCICFSCLLSSLLPLGLSSRVLRMAHNECIISIIVV